MNKVCINNSDFYNPSLLGYEVFMHKLSDELLYDDLIKDGIHQFDTDFGCIDILIQGVDRLKQSSHVTVCYSGAISNRDSKIGPFFSGVGFAKNHLNNLLISISDPSLNINENICIGWYAGDNKINEFPAKCAMIIDRICDIVGKKIFFLGGSGGGYGILLVASKIKTDSIGLIWNPQTRIQDHQPERYVHEYEQAIGTELSLCPDIISCVGDMVYKENIQILYLQNHNDHSHIENQLIPYLNNKAFHVIGNSSLVNNEDDVVVSVSNFGEGHAVPDSVLLGCMARDLVSGWSALKTAWKIDNNYFQDKGITPILLLNDHNLFFSLQAEINNNEVLLCCDFKGVSASSDSISVAFYLMNGKNEKLQTSWYSNKKNHIFQINEDHEGLHVICFIKDLIGNIKKLVVKL